MLRLTDLQKGVLGVDALGLTHLADVVVITLGALVSNSNDGISITSITDEGTVDDGCLAAASAVIGKDLLQTTVADSLDLLTGIGNLLVKTLVAEHTGAFAEATVVSVLFLKGALALGTLGVLVGAGLFFGNTGGLGFNLRNLGNRKLGINLLNLGDFWHL